MNRRERLLFVSATTQQQGSANYAPRYVMFAKGDQAEKLIIVGLDDETLGTIYRARALLAALSSLARPTTRPARRSCNVASAAASVRVVIGIDGGRLRLTSSSSSLASA